MAFLAELNAQTEELIAAVTSISADDDAFFDLKALRDATVRSLRSHNSPRANQFEVAAQLDGLEERFVVADRAALADALRDRRARLAGAAHTTKWTPDILQFLLELSDRPAESASLDALEALLAARRATGAGPRPLRWEDISYEDGWDAEPELWHSAAGDTSGDDYDYDDYDYEEEEEEDDEEEEDQRSENTTMSSIASPDAQTRTYQSLVSEEHSRSELAALLASVRASQAWRGRGQLQPQKEEDPPASRDGKILISELQAVRESLFMLQGLETTLFGTDCVLVDGYCLADVSVAAHTSLLSAVAASGQRLKPLRLRVSRGGSGSRNDNVPLLQVFQEAIRRRLHAFDRTLSDMHARFVAPPLRADDDVLVSLVAVMDELQPSLVCLSALAAVVQTLEAERHNTHAFRYLEILFDAACVAQLTGEHALYAFLATIFFECFQVYLRPIRLWMEDGQLLAGDKIFFVAGGGAARPAAVTVTVPRNQIWQSQYKLLRTSAGSLHAPRFLQPAAGKIFTTGKSIVVLRQLGRYSSSSSKATTEPIMDFDHVCPRGTEMAPFAQLFEEAFAGWIQSKHHAASATLQATLFDACGLWASLDALHCVYLMADGAATDAFVARVFHGLDTRDARWHDRYAMTEFAREAFADRLDDASRLSVGLDSGDNDPAVARRSVRRGIARIRLAYRLSWPVQIIIPADSLAGYQAVFTLLLQVRRASSLLSGHRLLDDGVVDDSDGLFTGAPALYLTLRARLLWFCNTLQSYLVTLVIAPRMHALRADLARAVDVDAMIHVHAQCITALVAEACLGDTLRPIRDAMLDLLDLAIRLEDAHRAHAARAASALHETWRLSVLSSPSYVTPSAKTRAVGLSAVGGGSVRRRLFAATTPTTRRRDDDYGSEGDGEEEEEEEDNASTSTKQPPNYGDTLRTISTDMADSLRFVTGGLHAVARASSDATAAAKWDMLAEMLDDGSRRADRLRF